MRDAKSDETSFRSGFASRSEEAELGDEMADNLNSLLEPGMLVRNPASPEWGLGQVQSNINGKVTVNFENMGKMTLDSERIYLTIELGG